VVYVDHDPVAVAHSRAVLGGNPDTAVVAADLRKPREILRSPEVGGLLDLERPVALLLIAVLHFIEDADDPYGAVAELSEALAPGSMLIVTHASYEGMPISTERAGGAVDVYRNDVRNPLIMRNREQIGRFFQGYEVAEPGIVQMPVWRPQTAPEDEDPFTFAGYVGVGRKP
jgi:hypothetical protein